MTTPWQGRNTAKDQIRQQVWNDLERADSVHSSPMGHIPNFKQAHAAAQCLTQLNIWKQAQVIKCNPDKAQMPVRAAALESGKTLLMAVPQLRQRECFVRVTREEVQDSGMSWEDAAIAQNILKLGTPIAFEAMPLIDLVIVGCVAVDGQGGRTGKGAGFADLELGLLQQFERLSLKTPITTTVDSLQVVDQVLPMEPHDWPLDWVVTPEKAIATHTSYTRPQGIDWDAIQADQWENIPILQKVTPQTMTISPVTNNLKHLYEAD